MVCDVSVSRDYLALCFAPGRGRVCGKWGVGVRLNAAAASLGDVVLDSTWVHVAT